MKSRIYKWTCLGLLVPSLSSFIFASNGLAPEVTDLNAKDISYEKEFKLEYLKEPYLSFSPSDMKDGIEVGSVADLIQKKALEKYIDKVIQAHDDQKHNVDSLLVWHEGKLLVESYFRRGRANYPHYQMSIAKTYTALAIGRAIQLGHLSEDDLDKPVIDFLDQIDVQKIVKGADSITLNDVMRMRSGLRIDPKKAGAYIRGNRGKLKGQGQVQAYFELSAPVTPETKLEFKYQPADPTIAMQVLQSVVPGGAQKFMRDELFGKLGIDNYHWQADLSGYPKAAAGCSFRSRDMLKIGMMIMDKGLWKSEQILPSSYVEAATNFKPENRDQRYGYFWWTEMVTVKKKSLFCIEGRGAGGQFIFMYPELDLIVVTTAHNKGMGTMLYDIPRQVVPVFVNP